jgi:uncharacterized membrane protein YhhN
VGLTLFLVAAGIALLDWVAVERRLFRLEYVFKPLTLVLLIAAAVAADMGPAHPWIVAGLGFGLLGDIGLMLSKEGEPDPPFLAGLGAFLAGHVCYLIGFTRHGVRGVDLLAGLLVVAGVAGLMLPQVLRGAQRSAGREFAVVVAAYSGVLSAMTVFAVGTSAIATAVGGGLFLVSDTLIARDRFVRTVWHGPLLIIATYHAAQFLIVLGLITSF